MSGSLMALLEIGLVFGVVFAFGFYELWKLKQYKKTPDNTTSNAKAAETNSAPRDVSK